MYVYAYLCIDCRSQYSCFSVWTVSCLRMCIRVHMYAYAYVCKCIHMCIFFCIECCMHLGTWQVFCAPVHVQVYQFNRCFFNINVHICDTLAAGCAYMYVHVYMCIRMHMYMDAYVYL